MAGLRCDDDTRIAFHNYLTELFKDQRRSVKIDLQNRLGRALRRRNACDTNDAIECAQRSRFRNQSFDGRARRNINGGGREVKTCLTQLFGYGVGTLLTAVSEQQIPASRRPGERRPGRLIPETTTMALS